jgi:methionyl-tRNA formyltransferase
MTPLPPHARPLKLWVAGQKLFGAAALALCLQRGHDVVGVSSPPTSSGGDRPDRLRDAAERAGVPWRPAGTLRAELLPDGTDLIVCAHAHEFVGRPTRLKARLGAIGYHPSLLPLHRGRDAVEWTIRMRDRVAGGSVYWLTDGVDAGPLAAQRHVFVRPGDTAAELWRRDLFPLGLELLDRVLADVAEGVVVRVDQAAAAATWEPSIGREPVARPELPMLGHIAGCDVRTRF